MSNPTTRVEGRLIARVYKDLAELRSDPYPGVDVFTDDCDFRRLCLVLTPPSGPWKDLALHFDVALPDDWPATPPSISSSVDGIRHPNLLDTYICCDLLKPQEHRYRRDGYTGGYSPALTLRGLFLQFLTFFSSTRVEQDFGGYIEIGDHTDVCYVLERDTLDHWPPGDCSCRTSDARNIVQETLHTLWESNPAEEIVVKRISSWLGNFGEALDSVKGVLYQNNIVHKIQSPSYRRTSTYQSISTWTCNKCPYGGPSLPHHQTEKGSQLEKDYLVPATVLRPPETCRLSILHDNALAELASILPAESIIALSAAYPRFRHVANFLHSLLRLELRCFFLHTQLNDCILGIGIRLEGRKLCSDFDWLSLEAFDDFDVRLSIEKRPFDFFLPLAFSHFHFERAKEEIWIRLSILNNALRNAEIEHSRKNRRLSNRRLEPPIQPHDTAEVVFRMMNTIVISLMESCDDQLKPTQNNYSRKPTTLLHASEKAIVSYCHLLHLAICLCRSTPAILQDATQKLQIFIDEPETRHKKATPDLGELMVMITLVLVLPPVYPNNPITWNALCGKFLEEATIRNVLWVLKATPELEVMETGPSDYRLINTFNNSKTSLRLIMFQICFLRLFIQKYSHNLSLLDENYGFPEKDLPGRMVAEIHAIYKVESWPMYFRCIQFSKGLSLSKSAFCDMLRGAVQQSAARKYHTPGSRLRMEEMKGRRTKLEKLSLK